MLSHHTKASFTDTTKSQQTQKEKDENINKKLYKALGAISSTYTQNEEIKSRINHSFTQPSSNQIKSKQM